MNGKGTMDMGPDLFDGNNAQCRNGSNIWVKWKERTRGLAFVKAVAKRVHYNKMSTLLSGYILCCFKFQKQRLGIGLLQDQLAHLNVTIN